MVEVHGAPVSDMRTAIEMWWGGFGAGFAAAMMLVAIGLIIFYHNISH